MAKRLSNVTENAVFLNIPYDQRFRSLYLAYMAGPVHLGFLPRVTLGLPSGARRLDKISALIGSCRYSIHDLSRVDVDRNPPFATPRFNMPFELGLAVAWERANPLRHTWFVFEEKNYRIQKSLSDINGTDPQIHGGTVSGVLRELSNIFRRTRGQPALPELTSTYHTISRRLPRILGEQGAATPYGPRYSKTCVTRRKSPPTALCS